MSKPVDTRTLEKQIAAAKLVREQIETLAGEDPDFIRDSIEGETNLFEVMSAMVAADGEDDALVDALTAYGKTLSERKSRIEKRIECRRALMAIALEVAEQPKLETPAGTVTRKAVAPKAVIIEEAEIPTRFFKPQPPKLDKAALLAALKERQAALDEAAAAPAATDDERAERSLRLEAAASKYPEIPGATLSNGSFTIQIRK